MQLTIVPPEQAALDDVTYAAARAVATESDPAQRWWLAFAAALKQGAAPAHAAQVADRFGTRGDARPRGS